MPDRDQPAEEDAGSSRADAAPFDDARAFDASSLFAHDPEPDPEAVQHDDVGILFGDLMTPTDQVDLGASNDPAHPDEGLHLAPETTLIDTAEGHLFDEAETVAHPYTHAFPAPAPARPVPQHAAPRYGIGRPQVIAMAVGLVITAAGAGWALSTPVAESPVAVSPSPTVTVDPERVARVNESVVALAAAVKAEQTRADSFAVPLAAMAGSSDESMRVAADAARQAYVAALAAVKVPEPPAKNPTNASLDQLEREVTAATSSLSAASSGFRTAITTFRQSIPAFAATAVADNADAAEPFRTAVTEAAAAAAAADPFGPAPFAALDAWRNALAALIADQARAVAAADSSGSGGSGGGGTGGDGGGTTTGPTTPPVTEPSPQREPTTDPGAGTPSDPPPTP